MFRCSGVPNVPVEMVEAKLGYLRRHKKFRIMGKQSYCRASNELDPIYSVVGSSLI